MVTIVSITNNGDGTYTIVFSEPITNTTPGVTTNEPQFLMFSPSNSDWVVVTFFAAEIGSTVIVSNIPVANDCTLFAVLGQPTAITAADPFQIVAPMTAVS